MNDTNLQELIKNPDELLLEDSWKIGFVQRRKKWRTRQVGVIKRIPDFWEYYNNIFKGDKSDYEWYLFKQYYPFNWEKIKELEPNINLHELRVTIDDNNKNKNEVILDVMLHLIGANLEDYENVMGIRFYKQLIRIWIKNKSQTIETELKKITKCEETTIKELYYLPNKKK